MMNGLSQALPLLVMCQKPAEFLDHIVYVTEIDHSLSCLAENLPVLLSILNQHASPYGGDLQSPHPGPIPHCSPPHAQSAPRPPPTVPSTRRVSSAPPPG